MNFIKQNHPKNSLASNAAMEEASCVNESSCESFSKEVVEKFTCSICLELLYKPVVTACGHIFCFWCIHYGMNGFTESSCPLCRRSFMHFPRVCKLLHFVLMKAAPNEYGRRGQEVLRFEEEAGVFSPEIAGEGSLLPQDSTHDSDSAVSGQESSRQGTLGKADVSCTVCHNLLYRPVVLNCGDVFCKSCLNLHNSKVHCPACGAAHPAKSLPVCLELDQLLRLAFPSEYAERQEQLPAETPPSQNDVPERQNESSLHFFVGCDGCGIYPIAGDRYKCEDCKEAPGYDICGSCYNNSETVIGRFNQTHQSTHRMRKFQDSHEDEQILSELHFSGHITD